MRKATESDNTPIPIDPLAAPARRALAGEGIATLRRLSKVSEDKISRLHGIGPNAITLLRNAL